MQNIVLYNPKRNKKEKRKIPHYQGKFWWCGKSYVDNI